MLTARGFSTFALLVSLLAPAALHAQECCLMPDHGGTADLPPLCTYLGQMQIIDGLPPGTTIQIQTELLPLSLVGSGPGGALGGTTQTWDGQLRMTMQGTGALLGFNRIIILPLPPVCTTHSAPRTLFAPLQSFAEDLYTLQGQITLDPDFDLLRVTAGTGFGMPSPGHTTLTQSGGNWAVDSFFDITYRIDFVGRPGGSLGGMSGSTTDTKRHTLCDGQVAVEDANWGTLKALYR